MIQYVSAWCISHVTSSKMYFRNAFHEICCTCFGHLVSHTCKSKISYKSSSLYFLASLSDHFCGNKVLFPLIWTKLWAPVSSQRPSPPVKNIPCAESELRYLKTQHIHCVEADLWNFMSQNILCADVELQVTEYSACGTSLVPYAMARMTRVCRGHRPFGQSQLGGAVIYCSILAVAPTGIFVCFLRYYQAVINQLTYDKDPDIRHTSWPKAAGTKLPTGSTRKSEGEFSTL